MPGGIQVSTKSVIETAGILKLLDQYGSGSSRFSAASDNLYERHLLFDNVINRASADPRDRFEAFARSVRDVLSQRWVLTENTYERLNPKRIYYLSMEFLIGRSLANNVTNLLLDPVAREVVRDQNIHWIELLEEEPDAALGNGGAGRVEGRFLAHAVPEPRSGTGFRPSDR